MRRPNILLLYTDQQRWDAVGANGNRDIITPNLDRLAQEGVNFDHYFVHNPVCMPSRISFLSGQYPSQLRITHMGVPVPQETVTLPKLLKNYGYVSGNIGKLHFLPHANRDHRETHPDYGFDHLEITDEPGCYEDAYRAWVRRKAPDQLDLISVGLPPAAEVWNKAVNVKDTVVHPEERFPIKPVAFRADSNLTQAAFVAEQTMEFMERHQGQNWLCIAGFYSPHSPWVAPQEFIDLYDPEKLSIPEFPEQLDSKRALNKDFSDEKLKLARQGYYAMVSEVDHHVGRILEKLEQLGQSENTIVIFTSDHGEWLGEHLKYGKSYPGHDCISRVPFIVRWPGGIRRQGKTISTIVEAVDMVPTVLEAAGIQIPSHLQGKSLCSYFSGDMIHQEGTALMESAGWKSIRTEQYRYVLLEDGKELLFDIQTDPHGYCDVVQDPAHSDNLAELRKLMCQRLIQMERPLPKVWNY